MCPPPAFYPSPPPHPPPPQVPLQLKITSLEKQLADAEKRSHQLFHQKVTASQEASRREKALQARVQELEAQLATGEQ